MNDLRARIIEMILLMKTHDPDYARYALRSYADAMPWLDLLKGVKLAMEAE